MNKKEHSALIKKALKSLTEKQNHAQNLTEQMFSQIFPKKDCPVGFPKEIAEHVGLLMLVADIIDLDKSTLFKMLSLIKNIFNDEEGSKENAEKKSGTV